jgi:phosphotransferase system HPr-like phosphotransfer protein
MSQSEIFSLLVAASEHAESLKRDILLTKTREEHVRITARANEAAEMVEKLKIFIDESGVR